MSSQLSDTQIDSQASTRSEHLPVRAILGAGIRNGIVHFEMHWEPKGSSAIAPTIEPFTAIDGPTLLYDLYGNWPTQPQVGSHLGLSDAAAGNPYWDSLKQGYLAVLEDVAKDCIAHKALAEIYTTEKSFVSMAFQMLISVPLPVLQGICGAGLQRRKALDEDVYAWLTNNLRKSEDRPAIYMIEFTDDVGRSLTYEDMRTISEGVRDYINPIDDDDIEFALQVERIGDKYGLDADEEQLIRNGGRTWVRTGDARARLSTLLRNLEAQIDAELTQNPDLSRPMQFVMRDIGYSNRGVKRLDDHLDLMASGNRIMVIFALVAKAKGLKQYSLHGDVIFTAFREEHAIAAEVMFSLLAQSYITSGKGFNSVQAGLSNRSNFTYTAAHRNLWRKDILEESPARGNAREEQKRIDEINEQLEYAERDILVQRITARLAVKKHLDTLIGSADP
jgi:hypothetical protein